MLALIAISGWNLKTIQELMGYEDIKMRMKYAHLSQSHLEEDVQEIRGAHKNFLYLQMSLSEQVYSYGSLDDVLPLVMPVGARAIGMGEAFSAVADDIYTIFYNPGGLAFLRGKSYTFPTSDIPQFQGNRHENYLGSLFGINSRSSIALSLSYGAEWEIYTVIAFFFPDNKDQRIIIAGDIAVPPSEMDRFKQDVDSLSLQIGIECQITGLWRVRIGHVSKGRPWYIYEKYEGEDV